MKCGLCSKTLKHSTKLGFNKRYGRPSPYNKNVRYHHKCFEKLVRQGKIKVKDIKW